MKTKKKDSLVPWQNRTTFQEALGFLARVDRMRGRELYPVQDLARQIQHSFDLISDALDRLCCLTCPGCVDNCCERATIWYDLKDLIYLHFSPGRMPDGQIVKNPGGAGCPNLKGKGCVLPRSRRPFVCTWYFCPDQKEMASSLHLNETILKIKEMRILMEDEFCRITAGGEECSGRL